MKILCIIPPSVPSYFNAGHHLPVFQLAAFLRRRGHTVDAHDIGALNGTWRDVCSLLVNQYDLIAVMNDFDAVDGFDRFLEYVRELAPSSKTITFGRGSRQIPYFFKRFGFDAIASAGDYEAAVQSYAAYLENGSPLVGVMIKTEAGYSAQEPGQWLEADQWALPDISEIPYPAYERLYQDDLNKFCGIPARSELVIPVARGCPIGCGFCDVPAQQGLRERRLTVASVLQYIDACYAIRTFDYVSMYAPTFTLKRTWVLELCAALEARGDIKWKCVTSLSHLDDELITKMGASGCVRISVGVETTSVAAGELLPGAKRRGNAQLAKIADACDAAGIELNCFVMVGMPGETIAEAAKGVEHLIAAGYRVRPTVFTPYDQMQTEMSVQEYSMFNRQLMHHSKMDLAERTEGYSLLYANKLDRPTQVMHRIPLRKEG